MTVNPRSAAENAKRPFFIAHASTHGFMTDPPAQALMQSDQNALL